MVTLLHQLFLRDVPTRVTASVSLSSLVQGSHKLPVITSSSVSSLVIMAFIHLGIKTNNCQYCFQIFRHISSMNIHKRKGRIITRNAILYPKMLHIHV